MSRMETTHDAKKRLPDGWHWVRLGEVIGEDQAGFACGLRDPQGIAQLRMNNLDTRGNFVWDDVLRVPHEANDIEQFLIVPGDVLFNNTNSTELVGKSALFEGYVEPIVYSNHFTRLRTVAEALLPNFLASWLNHQWQQGVFAAICNRWIGQSAVKADKLLNLDFPLPPLGEQRRIAMLLKDQMAAVEKARAASQARLEAVKTLPPAYLRQVFPQPGQPLPAGWRWVKLGEVCERIDYGFTASAAPNIDYPKFLRITDIQDGKVDWLKVPGCDIPVAQEVEYELRDGDIVFARTGATTGKSLLIREPLRSVFASYLIRLRAVPHEVMADFLGAFFLSSVYWEQISAGVRGGAQGGFNASMLKKLAVPIPPFAEQRRIAGLLKEQMVTVEKARAAAEEELDTIDALPAALLRRAFNGEI